MVEAAARLGIAKENLIDFSKVMLDLGNVSDLTSDQAATALARFANITGTAAEDYGRLGSTIVALGNNFATSESEITNMSSRLAAAGQLAGLSESQIMGLAAAMSSVGIQAEAGGTAMTQTLTAMEKAVTSGGEKLEQFAQVAGMSSQEFSNAWTEDPITAIQAFIGGLAGLDEKGESATQVLDDLGLSGIQQANMLKSLALANETLVGAVDLANRAWNENTELAATAAAKYDTTQAKLDMAANAANNLAIAFGDALAPILGTVAELGTAAFTWLGDIIEKHPAVVAGITAVVGVLSVATAGVMAYKTVAGLATAAQAAFNVVLTANPIGAVVAAVAGLVAALTVLISKIKGAKEETENLNEAQAVQNEAGGATAEIEQEISKAMEEAAQATAQATEAAEDNTTAAQDQSAALAELEEATLYAAGASDTLAEALKEQEKEGSLSLKTANDLIEAGYGAAVAIDQETGAVTLNREEYVRLASAKIQEQVASLESAKANLASKKALDEATAAVQRGAGGYWDMARAKAAAAYADDAQALDLQIAALNRAAASLNSYSGAVSTSASRSTSASKKIKTQAEKDLEEYKALKAALDHEKSIELVSEEAYYRKLAGYRDQYLTDDANISEYRKVTEQIYKYDKSLADQEAQLWADQTDALISELEDRVKEVTKQQDQMEGRLSGYGDLFEVKDNRMTLNSIQEQIDAIDEYENALTRLKERNISGGLMDEVLALDVDSATQYANQLLAMSEEQWEQYNNLWDEKQQRAAEVAEQFFKDQLDVLENEYNDKLGAALDTMAATSFASGEKTGQELIDGLASQEEALYAQAQRMADQVSNILAGAGRIPSNSELAASFSTERIAERFQGVTNAQLQNAVVGGVNALSTAQAGAVYPSVDVTLNIDGQTLARKQVDPMRQANRERPEVQDDK